MNPFVFRNISYGVYIVASNDKDARLVGFAANSLMQVTAEPATIAVSVNHDNYTNSCIANSKVFSVSILSEQSDPSIIGKFGFSSSKNTNKFEGVAYDVKMGLPVISDSCGYLICKVINTIETSTHTVFLGEVIDGDVVGDNPAMTYSYYHKVIKGRSGKNAPTYIAAENPSQNETLKSIYKCSVCGWEYNGETPFESLPDDFKCPICGAPKEKFIKV